MYIYTHIYAYMYIHWYSHGIHMVFTCINVIIVEDEGQT